MADALDTDQLLVQLACSIVDATKRRNMRCVDVFEVAILSIAEATLDHILLQGIVEVIGEWAHVWRKTEKAVHQHDREVVAPRHLRGVPVARAQE